MRDHLGRLDRVESRRGLVEMPHAAAQDPETIVECDGLVRCDIARRDRRSVAHALEDLLVGPPGVPGAEEFGGDLHAASDFAAITLSTCPATSLLHTSSSPSSAVPISITCTAVSG